MVKPKDNLELRRRKSLQLLLILARYYKLITAVLVIAMVAVSYNFILMPKYQQIGAGSNYNLKILEAEVVVRQDYLNNLKDLVGRYNKINQAEIANLKNILPDNKDIPGLFTQLQDLTAEYDLLLKGISINEATESDGQNIEKLNISLDIAGNEDTGYNEIKEFLSALENNLRLFDINSVHFNPGSPDYSVNIYSYFFPKEAE